MCRADATVAHERWLFAFASTSARRNGLRGARGRGRARAGASPGECLQVVGEPRRFPRMSYSSSLARAAWIVAVALASTSPVTGQQGATDPWLGTFRSAEIGIEIARADPGYRGTIIRQSERFPFTGSLDGARLTGRFEFGGRHYPFAATRDGDRVQFETGGRTYRLERVRPKAGGNPLGGADDANPLGGRGPKVDPTQQGSKSASRVHPLQGKWRNGEFTYEVRGTTLIVQSVEDPEERATGRVRIDGDRMHIEIEGERETLRFRIDGNRLHTRDASGETETLTRVGPPPSAVRSTDQPVGERGDRKADPRVESLQARLQGKLQGKWTDGLTRTLTVSGSSLHLEDEMPGVHRVYAGSIRDGMAVLEEVGGDDRWRCSAKLRDGELWLNDETKQQAMRFRRLPGANKTTGKDTGGDASGAADAAGAVGAANAAVRGDVSVYRTVRCVDAAGFRDAYGNPMEVFRMYAPEGWRLEGGVTWNIQHQNPVYLTRMQLMVPAKIAFTVAPPDQRSWLRIYPEEHFADLRGSPAAQLGQFPPGSNYGGAISHPTVSPDTYVSQWVVPRQRGLDRGTYEVAGTTDLPAVAKGFDQEVAILNRIAGATGIANVSNRAAAVVIDYEERGQAYREAFVCDLMYIASPGITLWWPRFCASVRAPRDEFESMRSTFLMMMSSIQGNPRWVVQYMKVADSNWRGVMATDALIRRLDSEITANRAQTNIEIHRQCYPRIGPWATYQGPNGRRAYLPTDKDHQISEDGGAIRSGIDLDKTASGWHDMEPVVREHTDRVIGR